MNLNQIKNAVVSKAVGKKLSVDSILGNFQKTLAELEEVNVQETKAAQEHEQEQAKHEAAAKAAANEAKRAAKVAANIGKLLNAD